MVTPCSTILVRAILIWCVIACLAVANGVLRELVLAPALGAALALPLSGVTLCMIVLVVAYFSFNFIFKDNRPAYFLIGLQWLLMTIGFEQMNDAISVL
jgi:hypothetical protein